LPPPARPVILGGMGEADDYEDPDGRHQPPRWAIDLPLCVAIVVTILGGGIVLRHLGWFP